MTFNLPARGLVFWPVGNGDSTTIVIEAETNLHIDLNHLEKSDEHENPSWAVIDELVNRLPEIDGQPYLSAFALTHPDQDHCKGFGELIKRVKIGELWFTPRIFREYKKDLSDDAKTFKEEAERRVKETIEARGDPGAGNRVRVIGYSDLLEKEAFKDFPEDCLSVPGTKIEVIDDKDVSGNFCAFVHAPFKDDDVGDRNDTSLGLQISLYEGKQCLQALLLGDLSYPIIKRIFDFSDEGDLAWNVLLAPHHCSKSAMYWKDDNDAKEELKSQIVEQMEKASLIPNRVVSSSNPVPSSNQSGDNPPHAKAKIQYETITDSFLCTMEQVEPIVAEIKEEKIVFTGATAVALSASQAADKAHGSNTTPKDAHTYGQTR